VSFARLSMRKRTELMFQVASFNFIDFAPALFVISLVFICC